MRVGNINGLSRQIRILLSISFLILFSIDGAGALDKTYYWIPSSGSIDSSGFTANWGGCNSQPTSYRITKLSDTGFTCSSDRLTKTSSGDQFLAIFPEAYGSDTQVTGKTGATFYLASRQSGYTANYRFDLGYAKEGTFTSLGYVTQAVPSSNGQKYTIDMSSISGTAPSGSYPALEVSVTTSKGGRGYFGTNGGSTGSDSGRFYVSEITQTPTPTPTPTPETGSQIIVKPNRFIVLDDPNAGTTAPGFFGPSDVRGGNWGTNYWSGESTTIRASAIVMNSSGSKLPGATVTFKLFDPAGTTPVNTATSITDGEGAAYYSYDLNNKNYWGNWKINANATINGNNTEGISSFTLYWWGCGQCHGSESPGKWGSIYTPKSYYSRGYGFHKSQNKGKHTETMSKGNCVTCHQMYDGIPRDRGYNGNSPTIYIENEYNPDWHDGKVVCQGCHAGSNISTTPQGKNPEIAGCYDTAGCHPEFNTNVGSRNSTSGYIIGGNYRSLYSNVPNSADGHTITSVKCIICHNTGHNISKPYNSSVTSNTSTENEQCWSCHRQRPAHYGTECISCHSQNAHNISISGGGPDCILCHGIGGSANHRVDENTINAGVHGSLNSEAAANGVSADNKKCWGCHQSDGNQPEDMGNKYSTPYRCYECHGQTKPYARVNNAMTVYEHFKNGEDIKAGTFAIDNSNSCAICHSVPGMKLTFNDSEFTAISVASHYGRNKSGTVECEYCHKNTSTEFTTAMTNIENNNLSNHSGSPMTPVCAICHSSGMLHDAALAKPDISDDAYCKTCHVDRNGHKAVNCAQCHTNNSNRSIAGREIHDIRYLQIDNTFSTGKTDAINCNICHQSDTANSSLILPPPQINAILHHSEDVNNGSKWGAHWTNATTACLYCHNDTRHNATPLGRPLIWNPSYVLNTTIGNGTNCADCHYQQDSNYAVMSLAFTQAGLEIPPEITNGSWNGKAGYYNHTLSDYTDSMCRSCHDRAGSATVGQLLHNVSTGTSGGSDCKACHDLGGSAPEVINFSAANNSGHMNLNGNAASSVNAENKKCWACHGEGTQPGSGHPSGYKTPRTCENCHASGSFGAPIVREHIQNGEEVLTTAACMLCHNNNGMLVDSGGIGNATHYVKNITDTSMTPYGHTGPIDSSNCLNCHRGTYTGDPGWGSPANISTLPARPHTETALAECDGCHKDETITTLANVDFHSPALLPGAGGDNCVGCHAGAS